MANVKLKRFSRLPRPFILYYVASGLSLRWIATAAATGPSAIDLVWLTALCGFFLPLAACRARSLVAFIRRRAACGVSVYHEAFGPFPAFMSAWTYWMSNLPYFPAILFLQGEQPALSKAGGL